MAWHRTIVSLLIAITTVLALLYVSTLQPEAAQPLLQPGGPSYRLELAPEPPDPAVAPARGGRRSYA